MWDEGINERQRELLEESMLKVKEWRLEHAKATFKEIEEAMDRIWARARAQLLQDVALASEARTVEHDREGGGARCSGSRCPGCGGLLGNRGEKTRGLSTHHDQRVELKRGYGYCPGCGTGVFPPG